MENEVELLPMVQETVLLNLEPFQVRTYNIIQSAIVTNAVDSERADEVRSTFPLVTSGLTKHSSSRITCSILG